MLVDVTTNAILYLRALTSDVNGLVYTYDPITSTGTATNTPNQSNAVLNPHRDDVPPFKAAHAVPSNAFRKWAR